MQGINPALKRAGSRAGKGKEEGRWVLHAALWGSTAANPGGDNARRKLEPRLAQHSNNTAHESVEAILQSQTQPITHLEFTIVLSLRHLPLNNTPRRCYETPSLKMRKITLKKTQ